MARKLYASGLLLIAYGVLFGVNVFLDHMTSPQDIKGIGPAFLAGFMLSSFGSLMCRFWAQSK